MAGQHPPLARLIGERLLQTIPLLLGITFVTYAIVSLVPGSPVANIGLNPRVRPEDVARIQQNLGLDEPWHVRYFVWLGNVLRGDLGHSLTDSTSVSMRIWEALPNTLLLAGASLAFALAVSIPLGVMAAVKHNSWFDHVVTVGSVAAYAVPSFWLAFLLIILFGVKFREWGLPTLPISGTHDLRGEGGLGDRLQHLVLPTIALGLAQLAGWTRYVRSSVLEVVREDFVRTAQAKGLSNHVVVHRHAFSNALLPLVTLIGLTLPELLGGAFIVEQVFAWNGIGRLAVNAAQSGDYPMIMGTALLFAVLTLLGNLIADVLCALLDPRIRHGHG